jgi:hypothetical protein
VEDLGNELEKRGALSEGGKRDWTYAPNTPFNLDANQRAEVNMLRRGANEPAREYVRRAMGHMRKHDPNMIRAGLHHAYSVLMDNVTSDFAHSVGRAWDHWGVAWDAIEKEARIEKRSIQAVAMEQKVPAGFKAYQVRMARHYWKPMTDVEYAVQKAMQEDPDIGIRFDNMWQIREYAGGAKGAKPVYLLPEAHCRAARPVPGGQEPTQQARGVVREVSGGNGRRGPCSRVTRRTRPRTCSGTWRTSHASPARCRYLHALKIMTQHVPQSFREMQRAYWKNEIPPSLKAIDAVGGRQNVRAVAELGDLKAHKDLAPFFETQRGPVLQRVSGLGKLAQAGMDRFLIVDAILEGTLRHATIDYLVRKQGFPLKRAERFTSHLIGDYRNVDPLTHAFPAERCRPVRGLGAADDSRLDPVGDRPPARQVRRGGAGHVRAAQRPEAVHQGAEGDGSRALEAGPVGRLPARRAGEVRARGGLPMALLYAWNSVVNKDLDDKLPERIRRTQTYLINPNWQTTDGRPMVYHFQTPWDMVLSTFGLGNRPTALRA